ncbi:MAG: hypothetical protein JW787_12150 [Sedimentisphaerales bacterium]|nr:hypothetical protein [Sedimentisphaerales bacterium]
MERHVILCSMVVTVSVVFLLFFQSSITGKESNTAQTALTAIEPDENEFFYPSSKDRLESLRKTIYENTDDKIDLTQFEVDLRKSLADGKISAWQNLVPKLTREECAQMPTSELAGVCFSTSLFTRLLLIYDRPVYAFSAAKIRCPCYEELFRRDDLWKGVLSAYSLYSSGLNPKGEPNDVIDAVMGLSNLPLFFQYPKMRQQLEGREILFIRAQLEALKKFRSFITDDEDESLVSSSPFFKLTTSISLVNYSLVLIQKISADKSKSVIDNISKLRLSRTPKMKEIKNYVDVSLAEIEKYVKSYKDDK